MTPGARIAAAAGILDAVLAGQPAEQALLRWSRGSRFAGSKDRAAVRDLVFDALRQRRSAGAFGGGDDGRALMLGLARMQGADVSALFSGQGHSLPPPQADECGTAPDADAATDMPNWLLPALRRDLGVDFPAIADAMRQRAPVYLRVNTVRGDAAAAIRVLAEDGIAADPDPRLGTALKVRENARRIAASRAYREGYVELQDLSPQLACACLPDAARVLDYCAGGGGKALALAPRARHVTAHDIDAARMSDLPARAARAGVDIEVARPGQVSGRYDLVLADVPCSGSGTWRRDPVGKWRLTEARLTQLQKTQRQVLDDAARFVASGGTLAYMTCSFLHAENDLQIDGFLHRNPGYALKEKGCFTPVNASDGFFVAVLRRQNDAH